MDDLYDVVAIGEVGKPLQYELPTGKQRLIDTLVNYFPQEEKAIYQFFDEVLRLEKMVRPRQKVYHRFGYMYNCEVYLIE